LLNLNIHLLLPHIEKLIDLVFKELQMSDDILLGKRGSLVGHLFFNYGLVLRDRCLYLIISKSP
jgi:hypothetical protein